MTQQYDNTNRGALFRNNRKEQDSQPDHTGSINVDGKEYYLNAWIKTSKSGDKFFSLSIKPKDTNGGQGKTPPPVAPAGGGLSDDIPFMKFEAKLLG